MKRTELKRQAFLASKSGRPKAKTRKPPPRRLEPGESVWKQRRTGRCAVCGKRGPIILHHLVDKGLLKRLGLPLYEDLRNALPVGAPVPWGGNCVCHGEHTDLGIGEKRIPFAKVPTTAREFAREHLGEGPAVEYWRRHYAGAP